MYMRHDQFLLLRLPFYLLIFCCAGCSSDPEVSALKPMQSITGRSEESGRFPVYRIPLVQNWVRRDPLPEETLEDTTKPLCDFFIRDNGETLRIAIHNFPSTTFEERIPPSAQIARWQQQLGYIDPANSKIESQAFNGYCGLLFWGETVDQAVLGWSLQLGLEHYRSLIDFEEREPAKRSLYRQMRSDVTIKATGPPTMLRKYSKSIITFVRSFELIEEIPTRP
jgi:hypothetical protein